MLKATFMKLVVLLAPVDARHHTNQRSLEFHRPI
jgi:hypothetical protein